jgi:hypothetical protein
MLVGLLGVVPALNIYILKLLCLAVVVVSSFSGRRVTSTVYRRATCICDVRHAT